MHALHLSHKNGYRLDLSELLTVALKDVLDIPAIEADINKHKSPGDRTLYHECNLFLPDIKIYFEYGSYLRQFLKLKILSELSAGTLVVHMRTGDILADKFYLNAIAYCPYPGAFYKRIASDYPEYKEIII